MLVAAVAPHRAEAFEAARALIDRIKSEAYVWKKESTAAGDSWV
ncbi:MAG: molybdenum cofactor biosynthesis protein MoaE [Actinomycetota bacterium]